MTIYIDNGETVKIYPVKVGIAKAVMALLEADNELVWSETYKGYGVEIVDKIESITEEKAINVLSNIDKAWRNFSKEEYVALEMAIKALKQKPILDKINDEIGQMPYEFTTDGRRMVRRGSVFRIIDKYRTKGDDKE